MKNASIRISLVIEGRESETWISGAPVASFFDSKGKHAGIEQAVVGAAAMFLQSARNDWKTIDKLLEASK